MKKLLVGLAVLVILVAHTATAGDHRIGGGAHYYRPVGDITESFESDLIGWVASYQFVPGGLFKVEGDVEFLLDSMTGDGTVFYPQAYAILGGGIYAGIGIGLQVGDGKITDDVIYAVKAGIDMQIAGDALRLDLSANYRFLEFDEIGDLDEDNITIALMLRTQL